MHLDFHRWPVLLGIVVGMEVLCLGIFQVALAKRRKIFRRHLGDRCLESLTDEEREQCERETDADFQSTWQRKLEAGIIGYHLPALFTWGTVTQQDETPNWYVALFTMTFWFFVFAWVLPRWGIL